MRSCQGLLLVEAVLAALVIAAGLVFITRGLASPLKALRSIEDRETLRALAQSRLLEFEGMRSQGSRVPPDAAGSFASPFEGYRWSCSAAPREEPVDAAGNPIASDVTLTVSRASPPAASMSLTTMWLSEWVPAEWR